MKFSKYYRNRIKKSFLLDQRSWTIWFVLFAIILTVRFTLQLDYASEIGHGIEELLPCFHLLEDEMTLIFIILPFFWSGLIILDKQTSVYEIARYEKRSDRLAMEILDVLLLSGLIPMVFSFILFVYGLLQEVQVPSFFQFILLYLSAYIELVLFGLVFLVIKKIFRSPFISLFLCSAIFILIFYREIGIYRSMIQKIFIYSSSKGEGLISFRSVPKGILIGFLTATLQLLFRREDVLL